jgi:hypothetical protein
MTGGSLLQTRRERSEPIGVQEWLVARPNFLLSWTPKLASGAIQRVTQPLAKIGAAKRSGSTQECQSNIKATFVSTTRPAVHFGTFHREK